MMKKKKKKNTELAGPRITTGSDLMQSSGGGSAKPDTKSDAESDSEGWEAAGQGLADLAVLAGLGGPGGGRYVRQQRDLADSYGLPEFDERSLSAPQLRRVADYSPRTYDARFYGDPEIPLGSPEMRGHQAAALRYLQRVGDEGLPLAERLRAEELQRSMAQQAQRNQAAILQNMAARGRLSGGDELAARIIGNQQSSDLARAGGADLAQLATLNRLSGERSAADLSGQIRGQDFGEQGEQANVLNRFNEFASSLMTQQAMDAAESQERAGYANVARTQDVSDRNTMANYNVALQNMQRQNMLKQQAFGNELSRGDRRSDALGAMATQANADRVGRENAIRGIGSAVGTVAGTAVGGPIGGVAGSAVGGVLGGLGKFLG